MSEIRKVASPLAVCNGPCRSKLDKGEYALFAYNRSGAIKFCLKCLRDSLAEMESKVEEDREDGS